MMRSLPPRVQAYVDAIARMGAEAGGKLVSVILFGSAATGGFSGPASDVDLLLVLRDDVSQEEKRRLRDDVVRLEARHGFRELPPRPRGAVEEFVERVTANVRSFFVCTRSDLLSGHVARMLDLRPTQALFVDRAVIPSIVASAVTVWGEELLAQIPMAPIRRFDVFKSFQGLFGQVLLSAAVFPLLPGATRYAMGALKRSVHNCFFCYHARAAPLEEEIEFFQRRLGPSRTLVELVALRREYRRSFAFVVRCLPTLARLHFRTASDNRFPRETRSVA
ncbi:MAG: nucleotidyltransferase domain-containing protein [Gemmatimonadota bacterium]|nr:nucleotidyltransferase domain-containing protein [Gemmatimonadota bacterium]